jgi:hypothetical protein
MKETSTSSWTNRLRHGLHQVADVVSDVVRDVAEGLEGVNAGPRQRNRRRRRTPTAPSSPPDELTRARAERILRDNGFRGVE